MMRIRVQVIIESDQEITPLHVEEVACFQRGTLTPETLGLRLDEAKQMLSSVQQVMTAHQVEHYVEDLRRCSHCQKPLTCKGFHQLPRTTSCQPIVSRSPTTLSKRLISLFVCNWRESFQPVSQFAPVLEWSPALLTPCSGNPFLSHEENKAPTRLLFALFLPLWPFYCTCLTAAIKRNTGRRVSSCHAGCVSSSSCVGCGSESFVRGKSASSTVFTEVATGR